MIQMVYYPVDVPDMQRALDMDISGYGGGEEYQG